MQPPVGVSNFVMVLFSLKHIVAILVRHDKAITSFMRTRSKEHPHHLITILYLTKIGVGDATVPIGDGISAKTVKIRRFNECCHSPKTDPRGSEIQSGGSKPA